MISYQSNFREIYFDFEDGTVSGYVVSSDAEQVVNWLHKHHINDSEIINNLRSYDKIAFLNNINVDEDSRGNGIGQDLLESFEEEALSQGVNAIVLIADIHEFQKEGFNLVEWYSRNDYRTILETESGPLMKKDIQNLRY